jgi:hypothetical protein
MADRFWILVEGRPWRIIRHGFESDVFEVAVPETAGAVDTAKSLAARLRQEGHRGEEVLLGLDAGSCLVGEVSGSRLPRRPERSVIIYEFEASLPVAAEEIVADFVIGQQQVLGVAARLDYLKPLLEALQAEAVGIRTIAPWPLLAFQDNIHSGLPDGLCAVAIAVEGQLQLFPSQDGILLGWSIPEHEPDPFVRELQVLKLRQGVAPVVLVCGGRTDVLDAVAQAGFECLTNDEDSLDAMALRSALRVLQGSTAPLIELRRDALSNPHPYRPVRGPLRWAALALAASLICLAGAFWYRAQRYEAVARSYQELQMDVFRQILPNQPVPPGIRSRLESELAKVTGLRGKSVDVPEMTPALSTLARGLESLPESVRYQIVRVDVEGSVLTISGEVRTHGDAAKIAAALTKAGFEVPAPRTVQNAGGAVSVTIGAYLDDVAPGQEAS